jgi:hypothetical protein
MLKIVVYGFGNADDGDAKVIVKSNCHSQRIVAANDNEATQVQTREVFAQSGQVAVGVAIRIGP